MDADQSLNVLIKLGFVGQDQADAARKAIQDASGATQDFSKSSEEAGDSAKESNVHFEGTRKVFSEIDRIAPGMGEAVRAAFEGPLGWVILLTLAVNEVREKLADYNKELDQINTDEVAAHEEAIKRVQDAWDKAATAMGDYYAKMATAGADNDPEGTEIKRIKEITDAQIESTKKIVEALGQVAEARIRANGGTPEQLAAAKEQTAEQLASLDAQRERATGSGLLQKEQSDRQFNSPFLQRSAINAKGAAEAADSQFDRDQEALKDVRDLTDPTNPAGAAIQKRVDDANQQLAIAKNASDFITNPMGGSAQLDMRQQNAEALAKAQDEADKANAALARDRAAKTQLEQSEEGRENIKKQADDAAATAEAQSVTNKKRLVELPAEITQAQAVESARDAGHEGVQMLNTHLQGTNRTLGEYASAAALSAQQTINILSRLHDGTLTLIQVQSGLAQRIEQLHSRINHLENHSGQ